MTRGECRANTEARKGHNIWASVNSPELDSKESGRTKSVRWRKNKYQATCVVRTPVPTCSVWF